VLSQGNLDTFQNGMRAKYSENKAKSAGTTR
jgi:hypothetical protein